jgi:lipoprotein-anchoring transpeptidase ErfK/SrfK
MRAILLGLVLTFSIGDATAADRLDADAVNKAQFVAKEGRSGKLDPVVIKAQILLDRARFSPGEIDGKLGENFKKALTAFASDQGLPASDALNQEVFEKLNSTSSEPALSTYRLSKQDVEGPFVSEIPKRLEEMKDLPSLGYRSAREQLAEKFHMSEELLAALNPGETFDTADRDIVVANNVSAALPRKVARIAVDKTRQILSAFDREQRLLAIYPATVGSSEKPAPSGHLRVTSISRNPTYRYNPDYGFKGVRADKPFTIRPGPNNPVGVVWIGLSPGQGYGIHGTPEPAKISKTESHGCVRLTNWDVLTLASALSKGVDVDFVGEERTQRNHQSAKRSRHSATRSRS